LYAEACEGATPITATEVFNDRVVPFDDEHGIRLSSEHINS
jgi:hypothetical protein